MKIALCAPTDIHLLARFCGQKTAGVAPGLGSTATTPLIQELVVRGHDVTVYTLSRGLPKEEIYQWGRLRIFVGPSRERHQARNFFRQEVSYLKRAIVADAPLFVHAHWTYEFALAALATGIPTVVTIHDLPWNVLWHFRDKYRAARLLMAYQVARRGEHFTAVSDYAASHFRKYLKPGAQIRIIPNGLPDALFEMGERAPARIDIGCIFATVLQGWSRLKNATTALRAYAEVRKEMPDARLLMFGLDYEQGGPAHRWAMSEGLDEGVEFIGALLYPELLRRVHDDVDVVVHPSLNESFCMVAAEAMALRKPVIAGQGTPGVREVLGYGKAGVLVDLRSVPALAEAMVTLARNADYRRAVEDAGFERASTLYRLDAVVARYEDLYKRIQQG